MTAQWAKAVGERIVIGVGHNSAGTSYTITTVDENRIALS